jgi:alkylglycerol monooxygenase
MYERVILWSTPAFFLLIALESFVAWRRHRSPYRIADAVTSVNIGALSTYTGVYTRLIGAGIYVALYTHLSVLSLDSGALWVWLSGLLLYDFLYYWYHRLGHEVNLLWAAHVVHHQSEEFNLSTALRQTGTSFLFAWLFYVPMAILGYPPQVFLAVSLIDLLYQFWIHTEQIGSLGVLDRILATPSNHRVHHGVNDLYVDRNYGGILMLWDRLFGTFQPELPTVPVVYGSRSPLQSWNPLWANLHTYWQLYLDSRRTRTRADRVRVWFRHPGWRPADVAARFPTAPFKLAAVQRFDPPLPRALAGYCLLQAIVALGFGTHYLAIAPRAAPALALAYLGWLSLSLWTIGGLCEGRRPFVWLEMLRVVMLGTVASVALSGAQAPTGWLVDLACAACVLWLWRTGRALAPQPKLALGT